MSYHTRSRTAKGEDSEDDKQRQYEEKERQQNVLERSKPLEGEELKRSNMPPASLPENVASTVDAPYPERSLLPRHEAERGRTLSPARSKKSVRSTDEVASQIKQMELAAFERLAELQRREMELEARLIKKRLETDIARLQEETDRESMHSFHEETDVKKRMDEWLETNRRIVDRQRRGEAPPPHQLVSEPEPQNIQKQVKNKEDKSRRLHTPERGERDKTERPRSLTPYREKDRGIGRLADALENMMRKRPPPRQVMDLPIFTGLPTEWLPYKRAMEETTKLFNISPIENLARMRNSLRGEAKAAVAALLYTANDPHTVMRTLEQCFGRPEVLIDKSLEELKRMPRAGSTAQELNAFAIKLQNIVCVMECVDNRGYLNNPMLVREVTDKLSPHMKTKWCDYAEIHLGTSREPEIKVLSVFLMQEADKALKYTFSSAKETAPISSKKETASNPFSRRGTDRRHAPMRERDHKSVYTSTDKKICFCCGGEHKTTECRKLKEMTLCERWNWARESRLCFICLNAKHRRFTCKAKRCGINQCEAPHHELLHETREHTGETRPSNNSESDNAVVNTTRGENRSVLLKVCPVTVKGPRGHVMTYALLDEGSTISLIDEKLANEIGAVGPVRALNIRGLSGEQTEPDSRQVKFKIKSQSKGRPYEIKARTIRGLDLTRQTVKRDIFEYPHMKDLKVDDVCYEDVKPQLLIGADNWFLMTTRKMLKGTRKQPAASLTQLGWTIHGTVPNVVCERDGDSAFHTYTTESDVMHTEGKCLHAEVERHFQIDSLGIGKLNLSTNADARAEEIVNESLRKIDNHYEVGLPWRDDDMKTPPSYEMAASRLRSMQRKMEKCPEFKEKYTVQIENLLAKGYAKKIEGYELESPRQFYLPHFAVFNLNKPGKMRLVFDAAAKSNGVSLNDMLLDGPDLLLSIQGILYRFRENPIGVCADIKEMFLRIKIRKEDQPAQMFLWKEEGAKAPTLYKMTSMIFGARCSPFIAHTVRNINAKAHADEYPFAYRAITEHHYVDDWVQSFQTPEEASRAVDEVIEVHSRAGFELAGWYCNDEEIVQKLHGQMRSQDSKLLGGEEANKTLGLLWSPGTDELHFNTALSKVPAEVKSLKRTPTKREALSAVMSLYDPLGLLSYYTITAKIILQKLWRQQIGWDDLIPQDEATHFHAWLTDLDVIGALRLERCYVRGDIESIQLHVFCDASEEAYGTAAYWRIQYRNGEVNIVLVAAKAKVAPLKAQTIPKLELQACLIGARLAQTIREEHSWKMEKTTMWSDSTTALHWINNGHKVKYAPFVAHRVTEILELTTADQWRWVPTSMNVADDTTRLNHERKTDRDRWFTGPAFLYGTENSWPNGVEHGENDGDRAEVVMTVTGAVELKAAAYLPELKRFSKYERLIRTTAMVLLFIDKCLRKTYTLNVEHVKRAERLWIIQGQKESFADDVTRLRKGERASPNGRLCKLDPYLDKNGLLRLRGRIGAADVPTNVNTPIVLDGKHLFTRLLVQRYHEKALHSNNERIVNDLRQKYHIIKLRPTVRAVAHACLLCRVRKTKPRVPPHGDLPKARLEAHIRPFTNCGIDFFGPMTVTVGRRHEKRWGALFTCLTTRAVHIELVPSLSTDSAIMALRRMAARRGWPQIIYSDNATNFRGADIELRNAHKEWMKEMPDIALTHRTEWRFITPACPNQGGAWERMIRSVKNALSVILKEKFPREEILCTLLLEIEYMLNARPLAHVPVDPAEDEALTPNHFLMGAPYALPLYGVCGDDSHRERRQWKVVQALANHFWKRWVREYLPTLVPRGKPGTKGEKLKEGDLVIVVDPQLPRNVWPRGEVIKTFPGSDGDVRSADVRTKTGTFRRAARNLAVLPIYIK